VIPQQVVLEYAPIHNPLLFLLKMICPFCSSTETKVNDKRESENLFATRRRRECLKCKKRFTTYERIETQEITIVKKDGRRELYNRQKLTAGVLKACEKRPIERAQIENIVDEIDIEIRNLPTTEIPSKKIGELVMSKLRQLDKVAYIRFASVYREFTDLKSFEKELILLRKKR